MQRFLWEKKAQIKTSKTYETNQEHLLWRKTKRVYNIQLKYAELQTLVSLWQQLNCPSLGLPRSLTVTL